MAKINVTIWNEFRHEKEHEGIRKIYPEGIHGAIAKGIAADDLNIRLASLDEPEHGLTDEVINSTDVMIWWGHCAHSEVRDDIVAKVHKRVLEGMGLIVLHSGHDSKIIKKLLGTSCSLVWREAAEHERLWCVDPTHPIARGLGEYVDIPEEEMYGEPFDIPAPDELVYLGWFEGGEALRAGCVFRRGRGKIFYFNPGHETYPTYHIPEVQRLLTQAAEYVAPREVAESIGCRHSAEFAIPVRKDGN